jgi:septal ring factor EnvC (AmiA/AmiB activator)
MNRIFNHLAEPRRPGKSPRILGIVALVLASAGGVSIAAPASPHPTADSREAKAELAAVQAQIQALTARLAAELAQRDAEAARLRDAELSITAKRRSLEALRTVAQVAERRRTLARADVLRTQAALDAERAALAGEVRAAYMNGRQEPLKILLHQTHPATLGRMLTYYGYFGRDRAAQIEAIRTRQRRLAALKDDIEQQSAKIRRAQADNRHALIDLERARAVRVAAIASLAHEVGTGDQQLAELKAREQSVEALLADLARVLKDFPAGAPQDFEQLRGKLPWPVVGHLVPHAHEAQAGVLIEAQRGAEIRAPSGGRVVYADWLQGLGLLLIIDHGGGYMSLYGRAEVLYKAVGDRIAPGDVIAALSDAAGKPAQLYFEIRQGRKAQDPKSWLKNAP